MNVQAGLFCWVQSESWNHQRVRHGSDAFSTSAEHVGRGHNWIIVEVFDGESCFPLIWSFTVWTYGCPFFFSAETAPLRGSSAALT